MPNCTRCQRPIASSRPTCLYCGAPLAQAPVAPEPAGVAAGPAGQLVGFWLGEVDAPTLADALGIDLYAARQRVQRGGAQFWRSLDQAEARAEAGRLAAAGLKTWLFDEHAVRAHGQPRQALGGGLAQGRLRLRFEQATLTPEVHDLLMVVRGPIAREYQRDPARSPGARERKHPPAPIEPGYRFHVHMREPAAPLELNPAAFEFDEDEDGRAAYLTLHRWAQKLGERLPVDDGFRYVVPALNPAQAEASREAIFMGGAESRGGGHKRDERLLLDNLAQFRFFSAWRGLAERERTLR
jgi:hypothetical protein